MTINLKYEVFINKSKLDILKNIIESKSDKLFFIEISS